MELKDLSKETLSELVNFTIDGINNLKGCDVYGYDLHNEIFNTDYYIIGRYQAEQWLINNYGIFSAIGEIKDYEMDNFGEVTTDLSEAEKVVNMFVYIVGELILMESITLKNKKNNWLTDEDLNFVIEDLQKLIS